MEPQQNNAPSSSPMARLLVMGAAFVILMAGLHAAQPIVVQFLLSAFIAIIAGPAMFWLKDRGVPTGLAILSLMLVIVAAGSGLVALIGTSVNDFVKELPNYEVRLRDTLQTQVEWIKSQGIDVNDQLLGQFDPGIAMSFAANTFTALGGTLTNTFLILLAVVFMLLEASSFPAKVKLAFKDPTNSMDKLSAFAESMKQYMAIKTIVSLGTGVMIYVWLLVLGVDYALLWGLLAFLLNYIPNLGSIIAAVPAVLLALIQLGGWAAMWTGLAYVVANGVFGNVIEPRYMGRGLGLSTLVVFLSLIFWGWLLGPVGMLLSVPLTMTLKIALESSEDTQWIAVMMGEETEAQEKARLFEKEAIEREVATSKLLHAAYGKPLEDETAPSETPSETTPPVDQDSSAPS